jgi:hypothetical protein
LSHSHSRLNVMFCRSLFVPLSFCLVIVLSVLWFTDSDYPFDIFKLFLRNKYIVIEELPAAVGDMYESNVEWSLYIKYLTPITYSNEIKKKRFSCWKDLKTAWYKILQHIVGNTWHDIHTFRVQFKHWTLQWIPLLQ